jgi:hypothetical protein
MEQDFPNRYACLYGKSYNPPLDYIPASSTMQQPNDYP